MSQLLHQVLDATAARLPEKTALVSGKSRLAFADLVRRSTELSMQLQRAGIRGGDRVVLFMDNGIELVIALYAVLRLGAICVPLNPQTKADKFAAIVVKTRASGLVGQASLAAVWREALSDCDGGCRIFVAGMPTLLETGEEYWDHEAETARGAEAGEVATSFSGDCNHPALISHTSGTTGVPKGVTLSHRNLVSIVATIGDYLGIQEHDVILGALPLSFNYGLTQLLMACATGATLVLERSFAFPVAILQTMAREQVTVLPAVPTMFAMLAPLKDFSAGNLPRLRLMTSASAELMPEQVEILEHRFPAADLFVMYGQTECTRISFMPPDQRALRRGSIGCGLPGQACWLRDESGERLGPGSTGELVVQGDHVMLGYWEDPEATARKIHRDPGDGMATMYTGDLFRSDEHGWLYFLERMDDIIKTRGEKVSPREVEQAILRIPQVSECLVVGVADPLLGQAVKAYVALNCATDLTEREVIRHCLAMLESYMAPKTVAFVDALPHTYNGKVRRHDLP